MSFVYEEGLPRLAQLHVKVDRLAVDLNVNLQQPHQALLRTAQNTQRDLPRSVNTGTCVLKVDGQIEADSCNGHRTTRRYKHQQLSIISNAQHHMIAALTTASGRVTIVNQSLIAVDDDKQCHTGSCLCRLCRYYVIIQAGNAISAIPLLI